MKRNGWIALALIAGVAVAATPAIARTVVDYARNAGRVDGFKAVRAKPCTTYPCSDRAKKLVATNKSGYLPNDILVQTSDSARLGGIDPSRYVVSCDHGSVVGYGQVPVTTGASWTQVDGYGFVGRNAGPVYSPSPGRSPLVYRQTSARECFVNNVYAEHVSVGVFRVSLYSAAGCGSTTASNGQTIPAVVTVNDQRALFATYEEVAGCDQDKGTLMEVHIFDANGVPTDATFTLETLEPVTQLLP